MSTTDIADQATRLRAHEIAEGAMRRRTGIQSYRGACSILDTSYSPPETLAWAAGALALYDRTYARVLDRAHRRIVSAPVAHAAD